MDLNKVMIIGRLTHDPEMKTIPSGQTVTTFSVATNLIWTDQSGQKQKKVEYHNVVAWRKLAEIAGQFLKKGGKVYIEGRLQTRSWEDQTGQKKSRTEIIANNMIMLDRPSTSPAENQTMASKEPSLPEGTSSEEEINVEDIPF